MKKAFWVTATVLSVAAWGVAQWGVARAQAPAGGVPAGGVDVVATRQAGFGLLYGTYQNLRAAVAAKADPQNYLLAAQGIVLFGKQIPSLHPPGSGVGRIGFPSIYSEHAEFEKAAAALVAAGEVVVRAAQANDAAAFAKGVKQLTESCAGCHTKRFADNWFK